MHESNETPSNRSSSIPTLLAILILGAFITTLAKHLTKKSPSETVSAQQIYEAIEKRPLPKKHFGSRIYEILGLSISLPAKPDPKYIKIPPDSSAEVKSLSSYYLVDNGIEILISKATFKDIDIKLSDSTNEFIERIRSLNGVTSFHSEINNTRISNIDASEITLDYTRLGQKATHCSVIFSLDKQVWQIQVMGKHKLDRTEIITKNSIEDSAKSIFSSIQITQENR